MSDFYWDRITNADVLVYIYTNVMSAYRYIVIVVHVLSTNKDNLWF